MRNMAFSMTTDQIIDRTKTVTRRFGWWQLKRGDRICAVEKSMGLKKGQKVKKLCIIEIVSSRCVKLNSITKADCNKEGFPKMSPGEFVDMICDHYGCMPNEFINRIEFEYVEG